MHLDIVHGKAEEVLLSGDFLEGFDLMVVHFQCVLAIVEDMCIS